MKFTCNSISNKFVLIISINFEELIRKKNIGFETEDDNI